MALEPQFEYDGRFRQHEPDVVTRVTEYVPQIIEFVDKIVGKGLAYASNGSVYLSIDAFKAAGHDYRKLVPSKGDTTEAEESPPAA